MFVALTSVILASEENAGEDVTSILIPVLIAEGVVIERFGKFQRILPSGVSFVVPFVDTPREFSWQMTGIDESGHVFDKTVSSYRVDLRESVFNFLRQEVYTKDTVLMDVNSLMFYRIVDIKKAVYEVDDLQSALSNTAQTQLKDVFGNLTFAEALESQERINKHLVDEFSKVFSAWGIQVERMELLDLSPKQSTFEAMKKQMVAERERRGEFIRSEGKKQAMRLYADGQSIVKRNLGLASREATTKISEGEAFARIELTKAEKQSLALVSQAAAPDGVSDMMYMRTQRFLNTFRNMAASLQNVNLFLPYDAKNMAGLVGDLPLVFGRKAQGKGKSKVIGKSSTPGASGSFPELD